MTIEEIKELFNAKIDPICIDIKELKESYKEMVELMNVQARHDESINHLKKDIYDYKETCELSIASLLKDIDKIKEKSDKKIWDLIRMSISAILGATGAILVNFLFK